MSVRFHLYKVNPSVIYNGYYMDYATNKDLKEDENGNIPLFELEKELGCPDTDDIQENFCWQNEQKILAWSDKKEHYFFDFTYYNSFWRNSRGWKYLYKRLNCFDFKIFNNGHKICKYLTLDRVLYYQGWFLKKRFFKKEVTFVYCVTKKQMVDFFNRYIDFTEENGRMCVKEFLDAWEDGMLFECSW